MKARKQEKPSSIQQSKRSPSFFYAMYFSICKSFLVWLDISQGCKSFE